MMMKDIAAQAAKKTTQSRQNAGHSQENLALDRRYGQIGISAVAAAARYQGAGKNEAYAPVELKWDDRSGEAA
jgi:hypothetical protein